jgi:hypothetical protein
VLAVLFRVFAVKVQGPYCIFCFPLGPLYKMTSTAGMNLQVLPDLTRSKKYGRSGGSNGQPPGQNKLAKYEYLIQ